MTVFGTQLKHWRHVRRMSQLDLSIHSGVTPRHVSFLETGRSRPGREVILRLAEALEVPLRDRNELLRAAGLPPHYPEVALSADAMAPFRRIVEQMLARHDPYPAFVLDRWWQVVDANRAARLLFLGGADPAEANISALDWLLSPEVRAMVVNWDHVMWATVARLRREYEELGGDGRLAEVLARATASLEGIPRPPREITEAPALCTRVRLGARELSMVTTVARFGSARALAIDELAVELAFPADEATELFFSSLAV